ncbi:metaxin-1b isoform X1 [Pristis pectinata]|uniref:metaxin-1b isoform X1 n=1 Tax=Pristis pectinata TaxID=685728 RepID=UPI00223CBB97|nr:metaxin-1b isoform X1 [Pristis pectinata]
MAVPLELFCWKGDWGLPSVDSESLTVLAYARFSGAPVKVHKLSNPWRSPSGVLPALKTEKDVLSQPLQILAYLRKQKYNADYGLSATQGADTMAFSSLIEEKLLPALVSSAANLLAGALMILEPGLTPSLFSFPVTGQIYMFWVDSKNYVSFTRPWYGEAIPFPLNFFLPNRMHTRSLERLHLIRGGRWLENEEAEAETEIYKDARECLTLLSQRLGSNKFFFGDSPSSLDAIVFGHLAPLLKAKLPNSKLQQHLRSLENLCSLCTSILGLYFPNDGSDAECSLKKTARSNPSDSEEDPHKRRNQILSVLVGLSAMLGYAFLSGILSIQRVAPHSALRQPSPLEDEEEGE